MAENEDGQEKTHDPTSKRLEDARKKGQLPRSRELNTMAVTLVGIMGLLVLGQFFAASVEKLFISNFSLSQEDIFNPMATIHHLIDAVRNGLLTLTPFFLLTIIAAIGASIALGGFNIAPGAMAPKLSKLNPVKGLSRVFSARGLVELVKSLFKFFLLGGVGVFLIWLQLDDLLGLSSLPVDAAIAKGVRMVLFSALILASTLILLALADVPYQLWEHKRQLKMTQQEVRDELKQTEGKPEVKGRIRQMQREFAQRRMMEQVPKADVIITNPTHYAVAVRYEQERMAAPVVVAKGADLVAANIRRVAGEHEVPIVEAPLLARAVYYSTELNEAIPVGLYLAVAQLLAYVYQLNVYQTGGRGAPAPPHEYPIPDEYRIE